MTHTATVEHNTTASTETRTSTQSLDNEVMSEYRQTRKRKNLQKTQVRMILFQMIADMMLMMIKKFQQNTLKISETSANSCLQDEAIQSKRR